MVRCECESIAVTFISLLLASSAVSQNLNLREGEPCRTQNGVSGKCVLFNGTSCPSQHKILKENPSSFHPIHCSFKGKIPIICCEDAASSGTPPAPVNEPVPKDGAPTGGKAGKACRDLELQINASFVPYIFAGNDTGRNEFPHMVALGYWNQFDSSIIDWACGGSLISNDFVLTAAHCVYSTSRDSPNFVWVGVHNISQRDQGRQLRVLQTFVHPNYSVSAYYNDVALLKIPNVNFDENTVPACLWTSMDTPKQLIITGWGSFDEDSSRKSEVLLKANLVPFSAENCRSSLGTRFTTRLSQGLASYMICARGQNTLADTCGRCVKLNIVLNLLSLQFCIILAGDSGGPLQSIRNGNIPYNVVGVTSFGPLPCGTFGVYDRVASFLDWIEPIVWPN